MTISDLSCTVKLDSGRAAVDAAQETLGMIGTLLASAFARTSRSKLVMQTVQSGTLLATVTSPSMHATLRAEIGMTIQQQRDEEVHYRALTVTADHEVLALNRAVNVEHELRFWFAGAGIIAGGALFWCADYLITRLTGWHIWPMRAIAMIILGGSAAGAGVGNWLGYRYYERKAARTQDDQRGTADVDEWQALCARVQAMLTARHVAAAPAASRGQAVPAQHAAQQAAPAQHVLDLCQGRVPEPTDSLRATPQFLRVRAAIAHSQQAKTAIMIGNRRAHTTVLCTHFETCTGLAVPASALTPRQRERLFALIHSIAPQTDCSQLDALQPGQDLQVLVKASADALACMILAIQHRVFDVPADAVMPIAAHGV